MSKIKPAKISKYELEVMKDDEALLFIETAIENGSDPSEAIADMRMIDSFMHMKKLHFAIHGQIKKTKAGNFRKGTELSNALMSVINGRANNAF